MNEERAREHVGRKVEHEIEIDATPLEVWKAWAEADGIARWFVDRAEGDAAAGELVTWCFDTFGYRQPTPCIEAVPGEIVAFGGELPGRLPFLLEVRLEARSGRTVLRLVNSGFAEGAEWDQEYEGVASGWAMALATLKEWLERRAGAARTHVLALRPATFEWDAVRALYHSRAGLSRWLAEELEADDALSEGSPVRMTLHDGGRLTGRVLAHTRLELLLSWEEQNGVLGLKAFEKPPEGRHVALDFNAWPLAEGTSPAGVEERLDALLARLEAALA